MVIKYFKEISNIPRASYKEEKIADYLVTFAKEKNLEFYRDDLHNVVIYKPASKGYESHEPVILQGHTDMVAEKNVGVQHDFDVDPIDIVEEEGWLKANGTTLGADDGVAVAYMLTILDDTTLAHPALECVFTSQEEIGLNGAIYLDASRLKSKRFIGLDSGGEYVTTISSSGGVRGDIVYRFKYDKTYKTRMTIQIRGLIGGHSGGDIEKERGNAIKIASNVLYLLLQDFDLGFSSISGGLKENAIPRECDLVLGVKTEQVEAIVKRLEKIEADIKNVYLISDKDVSVTAKIETKDTYALHHNQTKQFSYLMMLLPYGYFHKSLVLDDLVIDSMNIGTIKTLEDTIKIGISIRSPQPFLMEETKHQVNIICELCNCEIDYHSAYPGWDYDPNSQLRKTLQEVFKDIYKKEIILEATHGGLELGIFKGKIPELDIVAFGPIMLDIHTPSERLNIESFKRTYVLLTELLKRL